MLSIDLTWETFYSTIIVSMTRNCKRHQSDIFKQVFHDDFNECRSHIKKTVMIYNNHNEKINLIHESYLDLKEDIIKRKEDQNLFIGTQS